MQLIPDAVRQVQTFNKRYKEFKEAFDAIHSHLNSYKNNLQYKISEIEISELTDDYFDIKYLGIQLRFTFLLAFDEQKVLRGKVAIHKIKPTFQSNAELVGSFTFNGVGITNFDALEDGPPNASYYADYIACHFLIKAIELQ